MAGGDISLVCIIEDVSNLHSRPAWSASHRDETENYNFSLFASLSPDNCGKLEQSSKFPNNYCQLYHHQLIIRTNISTDIVTKWLKEWSQHGITINN